MSAKSTTKSPLSKMLSGALIGIVGLFLVSPILIIIPMSFTSGSYLEFPPLGWSSRWYTTFFESADWRASFVTSLEVALATTALAMALGVPAAFGISRSNLPYKNCFLVFYALPLLFPVIVSAVALYYLFAPVHLVGTRTGLVLGHTILALPVVIFPTLATLRRFDRRLEWQALSLGASRTKTILTVTLPLMMPTLIAVSLFAFITSFDEVVLALFLGSGSTVTLPKKIWEGLRFDIEPTVAAVATMLLALSSLVMLVISFLKSKRIH